MGEEPNQSEVIKLELSREDVKRIVSYLDMIRWTYQKTVDMAANEYDKHVYQGAFNDVDLLIHHLNKQRLAQLQSQLPKSKE